MARLTPPRLLSLQGIPYARNGDRPSTGLDCLGLARHTYASYGQQLRLERTSDQLIDMLEVAQSLTPCEPVHLALIIVPGPGQTGALITIVHDAERLWAVFMDLSNGVSAIAPWVRIRHRVSAIACVKP